MLWSISQIRFRLAGDSDNVSAIPELDSDNRFLFRDGWLRRAGLPRPHPESVLFLRHLRGQQAHGAGAEEPAGARGPRQAVPAQPTQRLHQAAAAGTPAGDAANRRRRPSPRQLNITKKRKNSFFFQFLH